MIGSLAKTILLIGAVSASLLFVGLTDSASAGRSLSDLAEVFAGPDAGARLAVATRFTNEKGGTETLAQALDGRLAVLIFVDYACRNMCSALLMITNRALVESGLDPRTDYSLVAIGLDPALDVAVARELKMAVIDPPLATSTHFLTGDAQAIATVTASVGYRYSADAANRQFAHAAAALVVSPDGVLRAAISGPTVTADRLRRELSAAHGGKAVSAFEPIRLLCYGLTPSRGLYNNFVIVALRAGAILAFTLLAGGLFVLHRRGAA